MKKILFLFLIFTIQIFSHHTAGGLDTTQFNFRFLQKNKNYPPTYFILSSEYNRGAKENRNTINNTVYVESFFLDGLFTLNAQASYIYYQQKEKDDAARYGKPYFGSKLFPLKNLQENKNFFFYIESRIGFATGIDNTKFIESNYYSGVGNIAIGSAYEKFSLLGRIGGEVPLSKNKSLNETEESLPYLLRQNQTNSPEKIQLKKTHNFSVFLNFAVTEKISIFSGFLYRTPFNGIEKETATAEKIPSIFREGSLGINYTFNEKYFMTVSYKNPLYRGRDFRPYESSIVFAFSLVFKHKGKE